MKISVVSPIYKAENLLDELIDRVITSVTKITPDYEIFLVDDRSPDDSWNKIITNCRKNEKVKGIRLSRNFGQHYAITAGLDASSGDYVVVMDCDLQHDPVYIKNLVEKAMQGNDIVYTRTRKRKHSLVKNLTAKIFFSLFNYLSGQQSNQSNAGSFSLLSRKVVNAYCKVKDAQRHYLMVLRMLGFNASSIEIEHKERPRGKSSYNYTKLVNHAINGITSQSDKLLRISISIGFLFFMGSIIFSGYIIIGYYLHGAAEGWTSTMVFVALSTGLILMAIGVLGIYVGKIFEQVKDRPLYVVDEKLNC